MDQTTTLEQTNLITPSIIPDAAVISTPPKDLITKVSEFKKSQSQVTPVARSNVEIGFDYKEIESIKDPVAKEVAMRAYKSMESGVQKKFQDLAAQRRDYEQKLQEMQNWTPERIQRELNNPQFVQSAQQYAQLQNPPNSGLTEEQYSALTPQEKAELARVPKLENEINSLKQINYQAIVSQRDNQLQQKYPDYNPNQIDAYIKELSNMSPVDIREHAYKSYKHDEDVAAAYELGKQESKGLNQIKINAITSNGMTTTTSDGVPVREKGETDQMYFMKMANFRLAQFKNRK